jgi:hypothetical protein
MAALGLLLLVGCDDRPNSWTAFVYRDASGLESSDMLTGFKSFEACQEAAIRTLRSYSNPDSGTYECGFKCEWDPGYQAHVCKETRR